MPCSRSIPLIINVEPRIKTRFKALCDQNNVTVDWALQDLMRQSIDRNTLTTRRNSCSYLVKREIETLKKLSDNYNQLLNSFNLLQKRVLHLEKLIKESWKI